MWCKRLACACEVAVQPGGIEPLIAKEGGAANGKKRPALSAGTRRDVIQRHSEKKDRINKNKQTKRDPVMRFQDGG